MNFEKFIEEIKRMVKEYLGDGVNVEEKKILKNNGIKLTGIVIMEGRQNCIPNIYLNGYFEQYQRGRCLHDIVYEISEYYEKHKIEKTVNMDNFSNFEKVKDNICFRLINFEKNEELLKEIPHIPYLDLAIVFYCIVQNECIGNGNILVRNEHLIKWDVSLHTIKKQAFINTERLLKGEITPMEDVICDMMRKRMIWEIENNIERQLDFSIHITEEMIEPIIQAMMHKVYSEAKGPKMYVLTNESRNYGAAVMLYETLLEEFAGMTNSDYYILPSSIHEGATRFAA